MSTTTSPQLKTTVANILQGPWGHAFALCVLFALCAFPSLYHDISRDALANSDMDLVSVYQALLINTGQPLVTFAQTGYTYFLALAVWFQIFDWLGLVPVHDMGNLLAAADFFETYAALIKAGRWFSIFLSWVLVGLVYAGVNSIYENRDRGRWIGFLLGAVLAVGGGGVAAQSVMLRTELPSMILIFGAALVLIAAPKSTYRQGLWLLGLSGFLVLAAQMAKIQNVIVIMFLPLLPLVFGWWERRRLVETMPFGLALGVLAVAVIMITPAAFVFIDSLAVESYGLYQGLIVAFVIACALIYGRLNLGAAHHGVVGLGAVAIGFSLAHSLSFFNDNWWTTYSVVNFLEQLSVYSPPTAQGGGGAGTTGSGGTIANVARSITGGFSLTEVNRFVIERLQNIDYPFAVFYVLVPASVIVLALLGKYEAAVKAGYLCLMSGMLVAIFWVGRGFFNFHYSVYVEAWVILAAAISLKEFELMSVSWPKHWLRTGQATMLIIIIAVVVVNVRFRLLDPATANPVVAKSACFIRGLTPLFYTKFDDYCGTTTSQHVFR